MKELPDIRVPNVMKDFMMDENCQTSDNMEWRQQLNTALNSANAADKLEKDKIVQLTKEANNEENVHQRLQTTKTKASVAMAVDPNAHFKNTDKRFESINRNKTVDTLLVENACLKKKNDELSTAVKQLLAEIKHIRTSSANNQIGLYKSIDVMTPEQTSVYMDEEDFSGDEDVQRPSPEAERRRLQRANDLASMGINTAWNYTVPPEIRSAFIKTVLVPK